MRRAQAIVSLRQDMLVNYQYFRFPWEGPHSCSLYWSHCKDPVTWLLMDEVLGLAADLFKGRMALDSLLRITEYTPWTLTFKKKRG